MGTQVNVYLAAETFDFVRKTDRQLYIQLIGRNDNGWIAKSAAGPVLSSELSAWYRVMLNAAAFVRDRLANVNDVDSVNRYARDQYDDQTLDYFDLYLVQWAPAVDAAVAWLADAVEDLNIEPPIPIDTNELTPLLEAIKVASE